MFVCSECGYESSNWEGRCPNCKEWNTMKEFKEAISKDKKKRKIGFSKNEKPIPISKISTDSSAKILTKISEFDNVLGGGIVPGMVTLIGGDPGIGKSTLMLQVAQYIASQEGKVLYVSGEESKEQIRLRADRLNTDSTNLLIYCSSDVELIAKEILNLNPRLVIIDSIQSVALSAVSSAAGSVSQLRESSAMFISIAKQQNIPIFMIGHVTKEGNVAGPKILEHMVDTVLYFEGEMNQIRILRTTKNRFGSTNEIGIFEMFSSGLKEVANPNEIFIGKSENYIGSGTGCVLEGTRAFLVEVQALVTPSNYGNSQRVAIGFNQKRLSVLLAIIEKHLQINMQNSDVFVKITGGLKILEPGIDFAVIAAVLSSFLEKEIPAKNLFIGEIGLNGEIRPVSMLNKRIKEARKLGYEKIIISGKSKIKDDSVLRLKNINQIKEIFH